MSVETIPASPVRIAVIQFDPQVGIDHRDDNLCKGIELAEEAVHEGAKLLVLPALANTGRAFQTRGEAFAHAESLADGQSLRLWEAFANEHKVYLVAGFAEREGFKLYNSAVLFGPDGLLGHYRKTHLLGEETCWFSPGNLGYPVFETPLGRIGLMLCSDLWFPEVPRLLALQGADIICSLNSWEWSPIPQKGAGDESMAFHLTVASAHVNSVFIAAANRIGSERGTRYQGSSLIAGSDGWPIAEIAGLESEVILYAEIDLTSARQRRQSTMLAERRTDLYGPMLGYGRHPATSR